MAVPQAPPPSLQLVAIFSRHTSALDWAVERIRESWGQLALVSERFDHSETTYYASSMGQNLFKQFVVPEALYEPAELAQSKLTSNGWEQELAAGSNYREERPVNIDPGYLTLTKLVLASAKDRAHRIYLSHGIYAEECLYYLGRQWHSRPWTYPDYQRDDFQSFFTQVRELLKQRIAELRV